MNCKRWGSFLIVFSVFFLALPLACPQYAWAGQQELAASIAETRSELNNTKTQLKGTETALNSLQEKSSGDLKQAYDTFVNSLEQVKATETTIKARLLEMQEKAAGHFESWQKDIDALNNADLRAVSGKRLDKVKKIYEAAVEEMKSSSALFKPCISDLTDISTVLSNDLTASGVKSISSVIRKARASLKDVAMAIDKTSLQMDLAEKTLSSSAK